MSARFVNVDRETPLLLPPDLREWVPPGHLAHFVLEAVALLDLSSAVVNQRGTGDRQYPPGMMLAVLLYCYSHGVTSSRQVERATYEHVAVRFLSGDTHPDHDTWASFLRVNRDLVHSAFVQVLQLAQRSGLWQVGTIALDGTKVEASASKRRTRTRSEVAAELAVLETRVQTLLEEVAAADRAAAAGAAAPNDQLPQELRDAQKRRARLLAAKAALEEAAAPATGTGAPAPSSPVPASPPRHLNLTDPASGLMPTAKGFIQGYNAQVAIDADHPCGLIVAADVVRATSDLQQLEPMLRQTVANLGQRPRRVVADCGYDNYRQAVQVEASLGCEVLVPLVATPHRQAGPRPDRSPLRRQRRAWREQKRRRLAEPAARALYARRGCTVEPAFGILKNVHGVRRFRTRGLAAVRAEWVLHCLAFNCRRLARRGWPA